MRRPATMGTCTCSLYERRWVAQRQREREMGPEGHTSGPISPRFRQLSLGADELPTIAEDLRVGGGWD